MQPAWLQGFRGLATLVLLIAGALSMVRGLWIPVKAQLAQILLERAWQQTLAASGGPPTPLEPPTRHKPWPWADTWPVARLEIERLGAAKPASYVVLESASGQALAFGPGLARRSDSNIVIAGHRDTHFSVLEDSAPGDRISLRLAGENERRYRVTATTIVDRDDNWALRDPPDDELLTLVTCYPFDAVVPGGRLRFVVQAERVL